MEKYPWETGAKLAMQVQARDIEGAEQSISRLLEYIFKNEREKDFEETKLRVIQVLTIASRSTYNVGGKPDSLFNINLHFIKKMLSIKSREELLSLARDSIRQLISIIPVKNIADAEKITVALQYIREHCTSKILRKEVAEILICSSSHLSRLFSEITGHTFKEFVIKFRMEKAKELLRDTQLNVTDIAYDVGYNDPNYFTAVFKRTIGISPSQYKKEIPV